MSEIPTNKRAESKRHGNRIKEIFLRRKEKKSKDGEIKAVIHGAWQGAPAVLSNTRLVLYES